MEDEEEETLRSFAADVKTMKALTDFLRSNSEGIYAVHREIRKLNFEISSSQSSSHGSRKLEPWMRLSKQYYEKGVEYSNYYNDISASAAEKILKLKTQESLNVVDMDSMEAVVYLRQMCNYSGSITFSMFASSIFRDIVVQVANRLGIDWTSVDRPPLPPQAASPPRRSPSPPRRRAPRPPRHRARPPPRHRAPPPPPLRAPPPPRHRAPPLRAPLPPRHRAPPHPRHRAPLPPPPPIAQLPPAPPEEPPIINPYRFDH